MMDGLNKTQIGTGPARVARILSEKPHEWRAISIPHAKNFFLLTRASGVLFSYAQSLVGFAALREHGAKAPCKIRPTLMPQPSDEGADAAAAEQ